MQVSTANDVKIYNLSSGKSIPDWLNDRQRRKLEQKNVEVRRRIQLIQDFEMPDVSHTVDVSPDGRYIFATGTYKPFVKCYDLKNLSLKFERGIDADIVCMKILSEDYSKFVILEEERWVELHAAYGRYFRLRVPRHGRAIDFCKETADLYIVGSTNEMYRLNLEEGIFREPLIASADAVNCCQFSDQHQLFVAGTSEGTVEAWDHRDRKRVGILDVMGALKGEEVDEMAQVTAIRWQNALLLGAGTSSGHVLLYDIRTSRPLLIKDQNTGLPIRKIDFVQRENEPDLVLSMDNRVLKAWHREDGKPFTAIEPASGLNDFARYPNSGLVLMACEAPKMLQYFVPAFGTAPKWCAYLETITEELEETEQPAVYDDYQFVTAADLEMLGLSHLVGTNLLRAYMHGYFMDIRLYNKARTLTQPFAFDKYKERKVQEEVDKEREAGIVKRKKEEKRGPLVNAELAERLQAEADAAAESNAKGRKKAKEKKKADAASTILQDSRFAKLFHSEEFEVDDTSEAFVRSKMPEMAKKKKQKLRREDVGESEESEEEQVDLTHLQLDPEEGTSIRPAVDMTSDVESVASDEEEDKEKQKEDEEEEEQKKREEVERKRAKKRQRLEKQRLMQELEHERRMANRPSKFTLHAISAGDSIATFMDGDAEAEEASVPLAVRKRALREQEGDMERGGRGREENTPFGGKAMTFQLKKKSTKLRDEQTDKAKKHVEERREERRKLGGLRKMMTPLPGNLVLDFGGGGRGGRGGGRGRGRGRGSGRGSRM